MQARFITFEGGEGAGKSTQIRLLAERFKKKGIPNIATREPGGTPGAEAIRALLVQGDAKRWPPLTEAFLHVAARADHVVQLIQPALQEGKWVLCDRFMDSTMAYQGYGHGLDKTVLEQLNSLAIGDTKPDLTFIFDIPTGVGLARSRRPSGQRGEDRYEKMDRSFHERLRAGFIEIATENPQRCHVIDASGAIEAISDQVAAIVSRRLGVEL